MEDMTLNNSAANAEVNVNESTSVNENVSAVTDTPTVLPESPVIGFQAVDAEGNVVGFISKADLVNEAKQALYADLAILEANRPTTLPANDMLADTSTLAATDVYEDQLAIKSDAPYIRGLDATGNPIRISKADLASVVGGLIGVATEQSNGLLPKNSYLIKARESTDKPYLTLKFSERMDASYGTIFININRPGLATLLVIHTSINQTSTSVGAVKARYLSGPSGHNIQSVRYIQGTDGIYRIEIGFLSVNLTPNIRILNLAGNGSWEWSSSAMEEGSIKSQVTAELEAW